MLRENCKSEAIPRAFSPNCDWRLSHHLRMMPVRGGSPLSLYLATLLIFGNSSNACAQSATAARQVWVNPNSQTSTSDLDRLVREKRYPELEHQLPSPNLTEIEHSYFEGILADRRNHVSEAIAILEKIVPSLRTTNSHRAATALRTLAGDYFKVGRCADASGVYSDLNPEGPLR